MKRGLAAALVLSIAAVASAQASWTVARRLPLPVDGRPVDLATLAAPHEEAVRVRLSGTVSFPYDGSELDAMGRRVGGERDTTGGPFVVLPPGSVVVESDPAAHRYVVDVPRSASMPVSFNVFGLAMRSLLTVSEVRAQLVGAIEVEHLVPPPPPPPVTERVVERVDSASPLAWAGGAAGLFGLIGLGFALGRRRRDPMRGLIGRAEVARDAVGREVLALGPAFDPVAASAARLLEVARQHGRHHASLQAAIARTAAMSSDTAGAHRLRLAARGADVRGKLEALVARLEGTATELAGRAAEGARVRNVDALLVDLETDLEAAVQAEEELAI